MTEALSVTAVLDASVLYPALLRNMLMRLALHGLFRARWSERIHEEWIAALLRNRPDLTRTRVEQTRPDGLSRSSAPLARYYPGREGHIA